MGSANTAFIRMEFNTMGISCKDKTQLCQRVGVICSNVSMWTYTMFISMEFNTMGMSCRDKMTS